VLASGTGIVNVLLLLWTIVPVLVVVVGAWFFLRGGRGR
jgi:TM2 domain-containing membrane protein YozV